MRSGFAALNPYLCEACNTVRGGRSISAGDYMENRNFSGAFTTASSRISPESAQGPCSDAIVAGGLSAESFKRVGDGGLLLFSLPEEKKRNKNLPAPATSSSDTTAKLGWCSKSRFWADAFIKKRQNMKWPWAVQAAAPTNERPTALRGAEPANPISSAQQNVFHGKLAIIHCACNILASDRGNL